MARGGFIKTGLVQRIQSSPLTLVVVYPPAVTAQTTVVDPFKQPELAALTTAPTRTATNRQIRCLWHDRPTDADNPVPNRATPLAVGWYEEATALARVLVADAALDPESPRAGSHFDHAEYVEFQGMRYDVLNVTPVAAGFSHPATFAVWLRGAQHQR